MRRKSRFSKSLNPSRRGGWDGHIRPYISMCAAGSKDKINTISSKPRNNEGNFKSWHLIFLTSLPWKPPRKSWSDVRRSPSKRDPFLGPTFPFPPLTIQIPHSSPPSLPAHGLTDITLHSKEPPSHQLTWYPRYTFRCRCTYHRWFKWTGKWYKPSDCLSRG